MAEVGAVELVATALGTGVTSAAATVAAIKVDVQRLREWVTAMSRRLDRVEQIAQDAKHKADILEVRL